MKEKKEKRVRLSMKLLWKMLLEYQDKHDNPSTAGAFLKWVEEQMKPLKP